MTTERIVATPHKSMQAVTEVPIKPAPLLPDLESSRGVEPTETSAPAGPTSGAAHEHLVEPPQAGTVALGLPPPTLGPLPATTLAVGVALQVIVDRLLTASGDGADTNSQPKDPVVTTALDIRSTGEVRETQFVRGVPKATNVVATDDRSRQRIDIGPEAQSDAAKLAAGRDLDDARAARSRAESPTRDLEPADQAPQRSRPGLEATASMVRALGANGDDGSQKSGILPSAILNAAMLPGWPPPRLLEGLQPRVLDDHEAELAKREAAIAALLEMLGIDPRTLTDTKADRKSSWLWLHRVLVIVAGLMTVAQTLASEIGEMHEEEMAMAEGRSERRSDGRISKRIYLD